jgi:cholesterol oxidase
LFVTIRDGADGAGAQLAQGMLTLDIEDLLWQGKSIKLDPPTSLVGSLIDKIPHVESAIAELYLARFAGFFATTLFKAYGGVLATLKNFPATEIADTVARPRRTLKLPQPEHVSLDFGGGFRGRLTRYCGGPKGPVIVAPGFSIRASSYAIDTVETNFAEALVAAGYDTWLFDYRASPDSGSPTKPPLPFTIDDMAKTDWPMAIAHVCKATGAKDVQIVAHCIASLSLLMALGLGTKGVRSAICSQFTLHPVTNWLNYLKADLGAVQQLSALHELHGTFDFSSGTTMTDREIDFAAWNIPVPEGEACKNPTCRRIFAVYGPSYTHSQLNHWTHATISEQFGAISIKPFEQLQAIIGKGQAISADGTNLYLTKAAARNMALPISFMSGTASQIFYPETAGRTRHWLASINGPELYRHQMFPGYAHMDLFIGKNASIDVFPWIVAELENPPTASETLAQARRS